MTAEWPARACGTGLSWLASIDYHWFDSMSYEIMVFWRTPLSKPPYTTMLPLWTQELCSSRDSGQYWPEAYMY